MPLLTGISRITRVSHQFDDFGITDTEVEVRVDEYLAELPCKRLLAIYVQGLVSKEDNQVVEQRPPKLRNGCVIHATGDVNAADFCSQCPRERRYRNGFVLHVLPIPSVGFAPEKRVNICPGGGTVR